MFIAYAVRTGAEQGLIRVRDVSTGADLLDRVEGANVNIDTVPTGRYVFRTPFREDLRSGL
jgi:hypothetical protein